MRFQIGIWHKRASEDFFETLLNPRPREGPQRNVRFSFDPHQIKNRLFVYVFGYMDARRAPPLRRYFRR